MTGRPAIQPYLDAIPAFTEDDVRQYVATHSFGGFRFRSIGQPTISKIVYGTRQAVSGELLQNSTRISPDQMVFYVELPGTFPFSGGPAPGKTATYHLGFEIFDAQTGNILVEGVKE